MSRGSDDDTAGRATDGSAWAAFCDALKGAGDTILRDTSPDAGLDRAEGYRYLSRLARLGLEKFVESDDPALPRFYRLSHDTAKIGCDNPDSFYQNAAVSGAYRYRITGTRGTVSYLSLATYYGDYGKSDRSGCSGCLEADELEVGPGGDVEIVLSCDRQPGNWLPMETDTSMLIVRQNVLDAERETLAELRIERIGAARAPAPLDPGKLGAGLEMAGHYVAATASLFADWAEGFVKSPNELRPLDEAVKQGAHGDPNIFFYMGYWKLAPGEALVIDLDPPPCEYWNFQLNNHWMESLDYRYHRIHLNKHTARAASDGSVRLVVADEDPGHPNWIDTAGHDRGTMGLRWVKAESHPQPRVQVVQGSDLHG